MSYYYFVDIPSSKSQEKLNADLEKAFRNQDYATALKCFALHVHPTKRTLQQFFISNCNLELFKLFLASISEFTKAWFALFDMVFFYDRKDLLPLIFHIKDSSCLHFTLYGINSLTIVTRTHGPRNKLYKMAQSCAAFGSVYNFSDEHTKETFHEAVTQGVSEFHERKKQYDNVCNKIQKELHQNPRLSWPFDHNHYKYHFVPSLFSGQLIAEERYEKFKKEVAQDDTIPPVLVLLILAYAMDIDRFKEIILLYDIDRELSELHILIIREQKQIWNRKNTCCVIL